MPRLSIAAICVLSATSPALPADLSPNSPRQSRLGAVFADPPAQVLRVETVDDGASFIVPPKVPGYYGRRTDFTYRNYYGTSPLAIFGRLPYACGFYGAC